MRALTSDPAQMIWRPPCCPSESTRGCDCDDGRWLWYWAIRRPRTPLPQPAPLQDHHLHRRILWRAPTRRREEIRVLPHPRSRKPLKRWAHSYLACGFTESKGLSYEQLCLELSFFRPLLSTTSATIDDGDHAGSANRQVLSEARTLHRRRRRIKGSYGYGAGRACCRRTWDIFS